jgi:hypothetical protein
MAFGNLFSLNIYEGELKRNGRKRRRRRISISFRLNTQTTAPPKCPIFTSFFFFFIRWQSSVVSRARLKFNVNFFLSFHSPQQIHTHLNRSSREFIFGNFFSVFFSSAAFFFVVLFLTCNQKLFCCCVNDGRERLLH